LNVLIYKSHLNNHSGLRVSSMSVGGFIRQSESMWAPSLREQVSLRSSEMNIVPSIKLRVDQLSLIVIVAYNVL